MRLLFLLIVLSSLIPTSASAQHVLRDPGIADGETAVYAAKAGNETSVSTMHVAKMTDNGRTLYEVEVESSLDDLRVRIDAATMAVEYSWVRRKRPDAVIETETKTVVNTVKTGPDEISVTDVSGLPYMLRGFPFGRIKTVRVTMAQGSGFVMNVTHTKDAEIKTPAGTFRCHELELSLDGFLGAFMPKTYFWYSREAPHYLVRYQGLLAGPGSPELVMELSQYRMK